MTQTTATCSEIPVWDSLARQELLSTVSPFIMTPPYSSSLSAPSSSDLYSFVEPKLVPDSPCQSLHASSLSYPMQNAYEFASQSPDRTITSSFTGGVFSDTTTSSWPSLGEAVDHLVTARSQSEDSYEAFSAFSSFYSQSSPYNTLAPSMGVCAAYPHHIYSASMSNVLPLQQNIITTAGSQQTVSPNALQRGPLPVHYHQLTPVQMPSCQTPCTPQILQFPTAQSASAHLSAMVPSSSTGSSIKNNVSTLSYESESLSSPSTDEENLSDVSNQGQARLLLQAPPPSDSEARDTFLLHAKSLGLSYREIKQIGGFKEAESTLRGRYRTITKAKQERVRKPVWKNEDIALLRHAVEHYAVFTRKTRTCRLATTSADDEINPNTASMPHETVYTYQEMKVPWKKVSEYISGNGGSYRFGNATCKKKWFEISRHE